MTRLSTIVAAAAVVSLVGTGTSGSAQTASLHPPEVTLARNGQGAIHGLVLDTMGRPLAGAMVSALGSTVAFALTGRDGHFLLDALPPGPYAVRIHLDGFVPAPRQLADVRANGTSLVSVALRALSDADASAPGAPLLAAGMLAPIGGPPRSSGTDDTASSGSDADHDHTETVWRLRHVKRSVLKNADDAVVVADRNPAQTPGSGSSLFGDTAFTGQVNVVTTGAFSSPSELWSTRALAAAGVAYVALGAPVGRIGDWMVRGAMTQGGTGAWFLAGSLTASSTSPHRYVAGLSYSTQHYDQASPLTLAAISSGSRSLGILYGADQWTVSPQLSMDVGLSYAWQDYVSGQGLLSPRAAVTLTPIDRLRVRAVVARYRSAPGSDEFLPTASGRDGLWLPAQRTFSPWSGQEGFRTQTTDHVEMGVERDIAAYVIGFRTFFQRVDEQSGAVFAAPAPGHPAASLSHYYVASVGDVQSRGWSVSVRRPIASFVTGSVDYSQTVARWQNGSGPSPFGSWAAGRPEENERIHDLTTSLQTDIPQTATRVFVLYKLNTGFARPDAERGSPGFDTRFDLQVNQSLPFLNFTSADWEVLVAVCNLFRETAGERSVYDELLVVRPPKRVVGGLRVRF